MDSDEFRDELRFESELEPELLMLMLLPFPLPINTLVVAAAGLTFGARRRTSAPPSPRDQAFHGAVASGVRMDRTSSSEAPFSLATFLTARGMQPHFQGLWSKRVSLAKGVGTSLP